MSYPSIEAMFGEESQGAQPIIDRQTCDAVLDALEVCTLAIAQDKKVREALLLIAAFWSGGPADQLRNDETIATQPDRVGRLQGRLQGIGILADELTNPTAMSATVAWLKSQRGQETA